MDYEIVRSDRRTASLEITRDCRVVVRAPRRMPASAIESFVSSHRAWLASHMARAQTRAAAHPEPSQTQRAALIQKARQTLPPLVERYASLLGVTPTGLRITSAKTRFGSCSAGDGLCFSWRLMTYEPAAVEYVVVHELCHIVHKNHGPAFYALVASVLPDWKARQKLLKM